MNDIRWVLKIQLDDTTGINEYPSSILSASHASLADSIQGPSTHDDWATTKSPNPLPICGTIEQIEIWLEYLVLSRKLNAVSLEVKKNSIPATSYFSERQCVARKSILSLNADTPPLVMLSLMLDDDVLTAAAIKGDQIKCQYSNGKWCFDLESTDHPRANQFLKEKIGKELRSDEVECEVEPILKLDPMHLIEPGRILSEIGISRYYDNFRLTPRNGNEFGTHVNTKCQQLTEDADYASAVSADPKLLDCTLASLITGGLLLLPAITLWIDRFRRIGNLKSVPTDTQAMRRLIDYLLKPEFNHEAAIKCLLELGLPEASLQYADDRFVMSDDWNEDQRLAFQLIIPDIRIESVFKLDQSRLDSRAVLA